VIVIANVFELIDKNIDDIFKFILQNDDIKRLLGNNLKTALTDEVPTKDWINDYLFDTPRVPDTTSQVKSFIMIEMDEVGKSGANNTYQFDAKITLDVICHEDVTRLTNGRRIYKLLGLINDEMARIDTPSIKGKFTYNRCRKMVYSNEFQGYRLSYVVTNKAQNCG